MHDQGGKRDAHRGAATGIEPELPEHEGDHRREKHDRKRPAPLGDQLSDDVLGVHETSGGAVTFHERGRERAATEADDGLLRADGDRFPHKLELAQVMRRQRLP